MSSMYGRATESLQLEAFKNKPPQISNEEPSAAPAVDIQAQEAPSGSWWVLGPNGAPYKYSAEQVQDVLNTSCKDMQVCPDGGNTWCLASDCGFVVPAAPVAPITPELNVPEGITTPRNPIEESLEMYPDSDLSSMALKRGLLPPGVQYDRREVIRQLAELGISTIG